MTDPFQTPSPASKKSTLILKLQCKSRHEGKNMKMIIIETLKEFKYCKKDFTVEVK